MNIVFSHGLGQNNSSWDNVIKELNGFDIITSPNLSTLMDKTDKTYENLYSSFKAFCDAISGKINLCGLSLGAILSLNYTLDFPEKVESLILIAGQYKMPKLTMHFQNIILHVLPKKNFVGFDMPKKDVLSLTKSMVNINFEDKLSSINCPTAVICGDKDTANLNAGKLMSTKINNASFTVIPNAAHTINTEKPSELAAEIQKFYTLQFK